MAHRIMRNKRSVKNTVHDDAKEKLAISSLESFSYSPKKIRRHVKIEYVQKESSNSESVASVSSISKSLKKIQNIDSELDDKNKTLLSGANLKEGNKQKNPDNKILKWEPQNWKKILENLKMMRLSSSAPVDTMGCDRCSDEKADKKTQRFHILVALLLSSQTKDQVTYDAMNRLKKNNLTPKSISEMDVSTLEQLLNPVSFYKNKAKYLKKTADILLHKYNSDIPNTFEELIKLPGIGPKMAHICMNTAWNVTTGIGVDVHVHRISNRLGWLKKKTKTPEDTRKELESWLPFEYWNDINHLMVGFGQTICTPIKPKCDICLNNMICPSSTSTIKKKDFSKEKQK